MTDSISPHTILREAEKDRILRSKIEELLASSESTDDLVEKLACWLKLCKCMPTDERRPDQMLDLVQERFEKHAEEDTVKFTSCEYNKEKDDTDG
jgi:hypothetical protein